MTQCDAFASAAHGAAALALAREELFFCGVHLTLRSQCAETTILPRQRTLLSIGPGESLRGDLHVLSDPFPRTAGELRSSVWCTSFPFEPGATFIAHEVVVFGDGSFRVAPEGALSLHVGKKPPAKMQSRRLSTQNDREWEFHHAAREKLWVKTILSARATAILRATNDCEALRGASLEHCQAVAGAPELYRCEQTANRPASPRLQ